MENHQKAKAVRDLKRIAQRYLNDGDMSEAIRTMQSAKRLEKALVDEQCQRLENARKAIEGDSAVRSDMGELASEKYDLPVNGHALLTRP